MDNANYILKTNEAVLMPTKNNRGRKFLKVCVWILVAIIIIVSFIFHDNIFADMNWSTRILLIVLAMTFGFYNGKKEYTPSPMELQFYDDYLVLYLPHRYLDDRETRKQINIMKYSDITKCVYKSKSTRVQIYGDGQSTWYKYKKDGSLPEKPTKDRFVTNGMIYFNTCLATDVDFIKEIEKHSPLKVIIEND